MGWRHMFQCGARRPCARRLIQVPGFCAHTLHHPPWGTLWPAKILQPAVASPAFPWNCAHVPHFWFGLKVGLSAALTFAASLTYPSAFAFGSFGSRGVNASAPAVVASIPNAGTRAPASSPRLTIARREILCCMAVILPRLRIVGIGQNLNGLRLRAKRPMR